MKRIYLLLIFLLVFLPLSTVEGQKHSYPFVIVQMTDPQFGFIVNNKAFAEETALYKKVVEAINRIGPDFVVITGDFVNDRSNKAQWDEFNRITAEISSSEEIPNQVKFNIK